MDNALIPAALILILTNAVFAALAELRRREIRTKDGQLIDLACKISRARSEGYDDGLTTGLRRGYGEMYMAVVKAHRDGRDPITAAQRVGQMNAEYLLPACEKEIR